MGFVRVRLDNGWEASVGEAYAQACGLPILSGQPAVDSKGRPLPAGPPSGEAPAQTPVPPVSGDDTDVWTRNGPPPIILPPGVEPGDTWIDVSTGDVYVLE